MIYHITWSSSGFYAWAPVKLPNIYARYMKLSPEDANLLNGRRTITFEAIDSYADPAFVTRLNEPGASDTYLLILVKREGQIDSFEKYVKENDIEKNVVFRGPLVTNPIHRSNGRNLQLIVLQSTDNPQRKEFIK